MTAVGERTRGSFVKRAVHSVLMHRPYLCLHAGGQPAFRHYGLTVTCFISDGGLRLALFFFSWTRTWSCTGVGSSPWEAGSGVYVKSLDLPVLLPIDCQAVA